MEGQITSKDIQIGLDQLVKIRILQEKDGKYKYHPTYKENLLKSSGNSKDEILLNALFNAGYFLTPKTEKEISVVIGLLKL